MFEAPRQFQPAFAGRRSHSLVSAPASGFDLQQAMRQIWRGKTTVLITTAAALLLAALFIVLVPHKYTAVTQILIDPTDLHGVGSDLTPANPANDAAALQVESQVRVLTSDTVLRRADRRVRIPMTGTAESLNLAAAVAVMLYEISRPPSGSPPG